MTLQQGEMTCVARISAFVQSVLAATKDVLKMYLCLFNVSMKGDIRFQTLPPEASPQSNVFCERRARWRY